MLSEKGDEIIVIGGVYEGKQGWLNRKKGATEHFTYVILQLEKGDAYTRIKTNNYMLKNHKAENKAEQLLAEFPKIHLEMLRLTQLMVECHVKEDHLDWFVDYFHTMLAEKIVLQKNNRKAKYFAKPAPKVDPESEDDHIILMPYRVGSS